MLKEYTNMIQDLFDDAIQTEHKISDCDDVIESQYEINCDSQFNTITDLIASLTHQRNTKAMSQITDAVNALHGFYCELLGEVRELEKFKSIAVDYTEDVSDSMELLDKFISAIDVYGIEKALEFKSKNLL